VHGLNFCRTNKKEINMVKKKYLIDLCILLIGLCLIVWGFIDYTKTDQLKMDFSDLEFGLSGDIKFLLGFVLVFSQIIQFLFNSIIKFVRFKYEIEFFNYNLNYTTTRF